MKNEPRNNDELREALGLDATYLVHADTWETPAPRPE